MQVHINFSEMCTPDVHAVGCRDQQRTAVKRRGYAGTVEIEAESLMDIACDYWTDFVRSDWAHMGEDAARQQALDYLLGDEPKVYPCVDLPER